MLRLRGQRYHFPPLAHRVVQRTAHLLELDLLSCRYLIEHILFLGIPLGQARPILGQLGLEVVLVVLVVLYGIE